MIAGQINCEPHLSGLALQQLITEPFAAQRVHERVAVGHRQRKKSPHCSCGPRNVFGRKRNVVRPFVLEVTASLLWRVMARQYRPGGKYVQSRLKPRPFGEGTVKQRLGPREPLD
jgi:hypothetical protein